MSRARHVSGALWCCLLLVAPTWVPGEPASAQAPELLIPDLSQVEPAVRGELEELIAVVRTDGTAERGEALSQLGLALLANHFYEAAADTLEQALERRPAWSDGLYYLAWTWSQLGRLDEARSAYRQLLEEDPLDMTILYRLARIERDLGHTDVARSLLERALRVEPTEPSRRAALHQALGDIALDENRPRDAVSHLEAALALAPEADRLHYSLALAHRALGSPERARRHLERRGSVGIAMHDARLDALERLQTGAMAPQLRGRRAFAAGRYAEAAREFELALERDPVLTTARFNLAAALGEDGRGAEAIAQLELALAEDPSRPRGWANLGLLLREEAETAPGPERADMLRRAEEALERALELDATDEQAASLLARVRSAPTDEPALPARAASAPDTEPEDLDERAWLAEHDRLVAEGRFAIARERLEEALRRLPTSGLIAHELARLLATAPEPALRDGPEAVRLAELVVRAAPTLAHRQTLVFSLAEAGRCERSAELQREVVGELESDDHVTDPALLERQRALLRHLAGQRPCRIDFED